MACAHVAICYVDFVVGIEEIWEELEHDDLVADLGMECRMLELVKKGSEFCPYPGLLFVEVEVRVLWTGFLDCLVDMKKR